MASKRHGWCRGRGQEVSSLTCCLVTGCFLDTLWTSWVNTEQRRIMFYIHKPNWTNEGRFTCNNCNENCNVLKFALIQMKIVSSCSNFSGITSNQIHFFQLMDKKNCDSQSESILLKRAFKEAGSLTEGQCARSNNEERGKNTYYSTQTLIITILNRPMAEGERCSSSVSGHWWITRRWTNDHDGSIPAWVTVRTLHEHQTLCHQRWTRCSLFVYIKGFQSLSCHRTQIWASLCGEKQD